MWCNSTSHWKWECKSCGRTGKNIEKIEEMRVCFLIMSSSSSSSSSSRRQMQSTVTAKHNPARLNFFFFFFSKGKTIVSIFLSKRTLLLTVWWKSFLCCPVVRRVRVWERLCVFSHFPSPSCRLWSNNRGVGKWCVSRGGAAASKGTRESHVEVGDVDNGRFRVPRTWSLKHFRSSPFHPPAVPGVLQEKKCDTKRRCLKGGGGEREHKVHKYI